LILEACFTVLRGFIYNFKGHSSYDICSLAGEAKMINLVATLTLSEAVQFEPRVKIRLKAQRLCGSTSSEPFDAVSLVLGVAGHDNRSRKWISHSLNSRNQNGPQIQKDTGNAVQTPPVSALDHDTWLSAHSKASHACISSLNVSSQASV
jgi:hypothetical protein